MSKGDAGKGDTPRPRTISDDEWGLRYDLATGRITRADYDKRIAELRQQQK